MMALLGYRGGPYLFIPFSASPTCGGRVHQTPLDCFDAFRIHEFRVKRNRVSSFPSPYHPRAIVRGRCHTFVGHHFT